MNFEQALQVIHQYQEDQGVTGMLETLERMRDSLDDLTGQELRAYRVVFFEMSKLFAPA